ncbi:MAG: cyclic nucleotide-binding domain-containing protein [Leptolyngbyaceae cyanobacterium SM1_3_5]|nr:cyclic nucleotide-binding domain-containing protein [Leptolyngbyaceae cyanobacterium SM1_3_5]
MNSYLKIGDRLLDGDRIIAALVQYELLEPLVGQILVDDAIAEVPLSQQEVFETLIGSTELPMPEDFDRFLLQWCELKNVTSTYLTNVMIRQMRIEKFKQIRFAPKVESAFLQNKSSFDQVEFSLLQTSDFLLAQELHLQLRDDDMDFAFLAQQYAIDSNSGKIGPVSLSTLPEPIANQLRAQSIGQVGEPIAIDDIYWIVRLDSRTEASLTDRTRASLIDQMYSQWLQSQVKALLNTPDAIAYGVPEEAPRMTSVDLTIQTHLPQFFATAPFNQLSDKQQQRLSEKLQLCTFRFGQVIYAPGELPIAVHLILQGRVRILATTPDQPTIAIAGQGTLIGWDSLLRRVPSGTIRAAASPDVEEVRTIALPADEFEAIALDLLPHFAQPSLLEQFDTLSGFLAKMPTRFSDPQLKEIVDRLDRNQTAIIQNWHSTQGDFHLNGYGTISENRTWLYSGGAPLDLPIGTAIAAADQISPVRSSPFPVRLLGIDRAFLAAILQGTMPPDLPPRKDARSRVSTPPADPRSPADDAIPRTDARSRVSARCPAIHWQTLPDPQISDRQPDRRSGRLLQHGLRSLAGSLPSRLAAPLAHRAIWQCRLHPNAGRF